MIEIHILDILDVLKFLGVWFVCYVILLFARFGDDISWKTELVAAIIALIPPVLLFTNLVKFAL